jgi:hypothetical protein
VVLRRLYTYFRSKNITLVNRISLLGMIRYLPNILVTEPKYCDLDSGGGSLHG